MKRCSVITYKKGIYKLANDLRLRILGNEEVSGNCLNFIARCFNYRYYLQIFFWYAYYNYALYRNEFLKFLYNIVDLCHQKEFNKLRATCGSVVNVRKCSRPNVLKTYQLPTNMPKACQFFKLAFQRAKISANFLIWSAKRCVNFSTIFQKNCKMMYKMML